MSTAEVLSSMDGVVEHDDLAINNAASITVEGTQNPSMDDSPPDTTGSSSPTTAQAACAEDERGELEADAGRSPQSSDSNALHRDGWRTKLYELDGSTWVDKGTGFVICSRRDSNGDSNNDGGTNSLPIAELLLHSEGDSRDVFFRTVIRADDIYDQQGDNIIMWKEVSEPPHRQTQQPPEHSEQMAVAGNDYALSFQEAVGRSTIW